MDEETMQAFEQKNFAKIKKQFTHVMPSHLHGTWLAETPKLNQLLHISFNRYEKETEDALDKLEAICFYEFARLDDKLIDASERPGDQWAKTGLPDGLFHERCCGFYYDFAAKLPLPFKYFIYEVFLHYFETENPVRISKHHVLNLLLLAKIGIIKSHFNAIIAFYKDYRCAQGIKVAITTLIHIYSGAIASKSKQLQLFNTPLVHHKFFISKTTADIYASRLLVFLKEQLQLLEPASPELKESIEVFIDDLDVFKEVKGVTPLSVKDLVPLNFTEDFIQSALEQIIGECIHQKDWPGEKNDILSSRFVQNGQRHNAAFMLKGRGTRGPLTISKCGAPGDQLLRLASSSADYYFIQHVDEIAPAVKDDFRSKMELFYHRDGRHVHCCFIDGIDTARILKAYHYL